MLSPDDTDVNISMGKNNAIFYSEELAKPYIKVLLIGVVARELEKERIQRARNGPARNLAMQVILLDLRAGRSRNAQAG
jgi:hypothetical protein